MTHIEATEYYNNGLITKSDYDAVMNKKYIVTNRVTGQVTEHKTLKLAFAKIDKYDMQHGAHCASYKFN